MGMEMNNLTVLYISNSGISLIMGLFMLFMQKSSFKLGTAYWGTGALIIGVGLLFRIVSPVESYFALVGSPILNTIGLYVYLAGIWKFKEKEINKWVIVGLPMLDVIQSIIFFNIFHLYRVQTVLHLTFLIIYCILAIYEMIHLNPDQKYLKKIFRLNALSFFIFLVLVLVNVSSVIINPDFRLIEINYSIVFIHIISGFIMIALTFGFLTAVNIRLNKELEDQIHSNTKFLSLIAHDLRGPVGNITSYLDLLQNESSLSEMQRKKFLHIINVLSQSTFHLLQNLLEWANKSKNINKFKRERIDVCRLLSDDIGYYKTLSDIKSIDLKLNVVGKTYISGSANMIRTIVRNLVSNAIKYTPKGGTITIAIENTLNKACLMVSDTGQGIKPETINSLFKFETNTSTAGTDGESGSGLGLVLCKELVSKMNGVINIESVVGAGTNVIVEFPLAE